MRLYYRIRWPVTVALMAAAWTVSAMSGDPRDLWWMAAVSAFALLWYLETRRFRVLWRHAQVFAEAWTQLCEAISSDELTIEDMRQAISEVAKAEGGVDGEITPGS